MRLKHTDRDHPPTVASALDSVHFSSSLLPLSVFSSPASTIHFLRWEPYYPSLCSATLLNATSGPVILLPPPLQVFLVICFASQMESIFRNPRTLTALLFQQYLQKTSRQSFLLQPPPIVTALLVTSETQSNASSTVTDFTAKPIPYQPHPSLKTCTGTMIGHVVEKNYSPTLKTVACPTNIAKITDRTRDLPVMFKLAETHSLSLVNVRIVGV